MSYILLYIYIFNAALVSFTHSARSFFTHAFFVSVLLTSGLLYHILTMGAQMGGKCGFLPEWRRSKSQHKFCSCVLKRNARMRSCGAWGERSHSAHHSPAARQYQDFNSQWKQRAQRLQKHFCPVQWRLLLFWSEEALFVVCSYRLMYIHLQFPLDVYGIIKHFNIQHSCFYTAIWILFIYLFISLKPQVYIFL